MLLAIDRAKEELFNIHAEGIVNFRSSMWLNLLCLLIVCLIEGSQSCSKFYLMFVNGQVSSWLSYLLWLQVS